ncbi:hypothetical protein GCM10009716_07360 [Streptomyces sodiiphilus]|uniref:Integral membrane protein n=1 Tax=Streptomyces sodiiphilus TaxID=226217 RepID=A0ABN2NTX8_9ACTN
MIVALVVAAEIAFWMVLAAGLAVRYLLRRPGAGAVLLLCVPLVDLFLLAATAIDLRAGAQPSAAHGLAALYLGFSVGYGHYLIRWADGHAAHRLGGGPRPVPPPRYGVARARHETVMWLRTLVAVVLAWAVLEIMIQVIADPVRTEALGEWQGRGWAVAGVHAVIALTYWVWPKRTPREPQRFSPGTQSTSPTS